MDAAKVRMNTRDLVYIAAAAALMAVCSWISIPVPPEIPFTLQTMAVVLSVGVLGGRRGTVAVVVYLLMGLVGLPVFAGFSGGPGALLRPSGGYLVGFLFTALVMWAVERFFGHSVPALLAAMILGLAACYAFGSAWFLQLYLRTEGPISIGGVLMACVVPYLPAEVVKVTVAMLMASRLRRHVG